MPRGKRIDGAPDMGMSQHFSPLTIKNTVRDIGLCSYRGLYRIPARTRREANQASGGRNIRMSVRRPEQRPSFSYERNELEKLVLAERSEARDGPSGATIKERPATRAKRWPVRRDHERKV
jgi:hypothetical protein